MTRLAHPGKTAYQAAYWRQHGRVDVAQALEDQLVAAGRCRRCGRILTHPESAERGLGPDCAALEERQR